MSTCDLKRLNEWIPFDLLLNYNTFSVYRQCAVSNGNFVSTVKQKLPASCSLILKKEG